MSIYIIKPTFVSKTKVKLKLLFFMIMHPIQYRNNKKEVKRLMDEFAKKWNNY